MEKSCKAAELQSSVFRPLIMATSAHFVNNCTLSTKLSAFHPICV